jgi:hypothetical protein
VVTVSSHERWSSFVCIALLPASMCFSFAMVTNAFFVTGRCTPYLLENHNRFVAVHPWFWWMLLASQYAGGVGVGGVFVCGFLGKTIRETQVPGVWRSARIVASSVLCVPPLITAILLMCGLAKNWIGLTAA